MSAHLLWPALPPHLHSSSLDSLRRGEGGRRSGDLLGDPLLSPGDPRHLSGDRQGEPRLSGGLSGDLLGDALQSCDLRGDPRRSGDRLCQGGDLDRPLQPPGDLLPRPSSLLDAPP